MDIHTDDHRWEVLDAASAGRSCAEAVELLGSTAVADGIIEEAPDGAPNQRRQVGAMVLAGVYKASVAEIRDITALSVGSQIAAWWDMKAIGVPDAAYPAEYLHELAVKRLEAIELKGIEGQHFWHAMTSLADIPGGQQAFRALPDIDARFALAAASGSSAQNLASSFPQADTASEAMGAGLAIYNAVRSNIVNPPKPHFGMEHGDFQRLQPIALRYTQDPDYQKWAGKLSETNRMIFERRAHGATYAEIGREIEAQPAAVEKRFRNALKVMDMARRGELVHATHDRELPVEQQRMLRTDYAPLEALTPYARLVLVGRSLGLSNRDLRIMTGKTADSLTQITASALQTVASYDATQESRERVNPNITNVMRARRITHELMRAGIHPTNGMTPEHEAVVEFIVRNPDVRSTREVAPLQGLHRSRADEVLRRALSDLRLISRRELGRTAHDG